METKWEVLLVDDEPDVHEVTRLALKRQQWRNRRINVTSAYSQREAEQIITERARPFHVAFVDVVMESDQAGLELCRFIRANCPPSFRIVLRTGQPGVAPEERVINDYDIDQYLAKGDATPARLISALTTSLRVSSDIGTLLAHASQLQNFTKSLHAALDLSREQGGEGGAGDEMLKVMVDSTTFLEEKHGIKIVFINDASDVLKGNVPTSLQRSANGADLNTISQALLQAHEQNKLSLQPACAFGLPDKTFIKPIEALKAGQTSEQKQGLGKKLGLLLKEMFGVAEAQRLDPVAGGFYVECSKGLQPNGVCELERDMSIFSDGWKIAIALRLLQEEVMRERSAAIKVAESYVAK